MARKLIESKDPGWNVDLDVAETWALVFLSCIKFIPIDIIYNSV